MKDRIIHYITNDRSYTSGVKLVMELSNNMAIKKQLNTHPQSTYLEGIMQEELRRIAGLSRDEYNAIIERPVLKDPDPVAVGDIPSEVTAAEQVQPKKASRKK